MRLQSMERYKYIVIEGNIGSGKTSLSKRMADALDSKLVLEEFSDNPFLPKFYKDQKRYAFPLELSFLAERYHQLKEELNSYDLFKKTIVSDYYFSKSLLFAKITLPEDEFELYQKLFSIIYSNLPKPDLYIFLYTDIDRLLNNIQSRGRSYEQDIKPEYLEKIRSEYVDFLNKQSDFPVLLIDNSNIDFVKNESDFLKIKDQLDKPWSNGVHIVKID